MKEIKVYMSEFPKCCCDCPCYDAEIMGCQAHNPNKTKEFSFNFDVTKKRPKDCPLIDIKTHDRELVKEVCEKISIELENETETYCEIRQCSSPHYQGDYVWFNYVRFRKFIDQIQKDIENG